MDNTSTQASNNAQETGPKSSDPGSEPPLSKRRHRFMAIRPIFSFQPENAEKTMHTPSLFALDLVPKMQAI